jgi:hypothetical protein
MDQGNVATTTSAGHYVRLALIFFASVFGLLLLGFAFGSSPASADDGGPDDGGLVPIVTELAGGVVGTVAPVATPVVAAIPLADVPTSPVSTTLATVTDIAPVVGEVLESSPAGVAVGALVKTVDETIDSTIATAVGTVTDVVGPVVRVLPVAAVNSAIADTATASVVAAAGAISGTAHGLWTTTSGPLGTGAVGASGPAVAGFMLPVAVLGTGFLVLLFSRRLGLVNSTLPVSPVYETDTSPD